jgi:hypothetical protein
MTEDRITEGHMTEGRMNRVVKLAERPKGMPGPSPSTTYP